MLPTKWECFLRATQRVAVGPLVQLQLVCKLPKLQRQVRCCGRTLITTRSMRHGGKQGDSCGQLARTFWTYEKSHIDTLEDTLITPEKIDASKFSKNSLLSIRKRLLDSWHLISGVDFILEPDFPDWQSLRHTHGHLEWWVNPSWCRSCCHQRPRAFKNWIQGKNSACTHAINCEFTGDPSKYKATWGQQVRHRKQEPAARPARPVLLVESSAYSTYSPRVDDCWCEEESIQTTDPTTTSTLSPTFMHLLFRAGIDFVRPSAGGFKANRIETKLKQTWKLKRSYTETSCVILLKHVL